jgi:WD40 repeat protein
VDREPLAADCRGENNLQRLIAMDNVVLKLCAAMFNLNYDDLKQRHRERMIRRRIMALSGALAIVTLFALTCLFYSIRISQQKNQIEDKYASTMATVSGELLSNGLRKDAIYAVRSVLPDKESKGYNSDAYRALVKATAPYETAKMFFPGESFDVPLDLQGLAFSDDNKYALVNGQGYSSVIDIAANTEVKRVDDGFAVMCDEGVIYTNDSMQLVYSKLDGGEETVLTNGPADVYYSAGEETALAFLDEGIAGYKGDEEEFFLDLAQYGIDYDYTVDDVFITEDGKTACFAIEGLSTGWIGTVDVAEGELKMLAEIDVVNYPIVCFYNNLLYLCYEEEESYSLNGQNTIIDAYGAFSGELKGKTTIPGNGFYKMQACDEGIIVISDRLSYIMEYDFTVINTISGYMDAMCVFHEDGGYVILDGLGRMFCAGVISDVNKIYSIYGHDDSTLIGTTIYKDGDFYVNAKDSGRVVKYSVMGEQYAALKDAADDAADEEVGEISLDNLQGIENISIFAKSISDDGKYIAVTSNDDTLYIYETASGKVIKEIYNSNLVMSHRKFYHLDAMNMYIIENRVFDKNFNIISDLPQGEIVQKESDGKSVIVRSPYSLYTFYRITLLSYDEVLKKADEVLDGYEPDERMKEKYNM